MVINTWVWVLGYDYLAHSWLDGPLRVEEDALVPWLEGLGKFDASLARDAADLVRCLDEPDDLKAAMWDFQNCVVVPIPGRYVPPYASVYLDPSKSLWGAVTSLVRGKYNEADLDWVGHSLRYPWVRAPDHLGIECAFAAELWAASQSEQPPRMQRSQAFMARHMLEWVPQHVKQMQEQVMSLYWRRMAEFLDSWVHVNSLLLSEASVDNSNYPTLNGANIGDR